jgi:hypothetical protein
MDREKIIHDIRVQLGIRLSKHTAINAQFLVAEIMEVIDMAIPHEMTALVHDDVPASNQRLILYGDKTIAHRASWGEGESVGFVTGKYIHLGRLVAYLAQPENLGQFYLSRHIATGIGENKIACQQLFVGD